MPLMKCPVDGETLIVSERASVEIDYCPKCRGVWLDRGELDKIIARAEGPAPAARAAPEAPRTESLRRDDARFGGQGDDDDDYRRDGKGRRKREGFLSDLFDF
jgi:uncharacterized protein